jgi:hypothetical protein
MKQKLILMLIGALLTTLAHAQAPSGHLEIIARASDGSVAIKLEDDSDNKINRDNYGVFIAVITVKNGASSCGMAISVGDTTLATKRLSSGEVWTFRTSGSGWGGDVWFLQAKGTPVKGWLDSSEPCNNEVSAYLTLDTSRSPRPSLRQAVTAEVFASKQKKAASNLSSSVQNAQSKIPLDRQDMLLMVRKGSKSFEQYKTLDGTTKLRVSSSRQDVSLCFDALTGSFGDFTFEVMSQAARAEVRNFLSTRLRVNILEINESSCIFRDERGYARFQLNPDLVFVSRDTLPVLFKIAPTFDVDYSLIHEVRLSSVFSAAQSIVDLEAQRIRAKELQAEEFNILAQTGSREKIGSISLGIPKNNQSISVCALKSGWELGSAMNVYASRRMLTQGDEFRLQAEKFSARFDERKILSQVFDNTEELYAALQKNPDTCLIYIDIPERLKQISDALKRDGSKVTSIGKLISTSELLEEYAKSEGYRDLSSYQAARQMNVNLQQFKALEEYAIVNKAVLDQVTNEMRNSRYSDSTEISEILEFLRDRAAASAKPGANLFTIREARLKAAREAAEVEAAAERRRREAYAKEFPFIAVLSCGMPQHINMVACLMGSGRSRLETEIKLRNGSEVGVYKAYNLEKVGIQQRDGLRIDLRRNFDLTAQNANRDLILGLKVIDRTNEKVIYQDQTSGFGVVRIRN